MDGATPRAKTRSPPPLAVQAFRESTHRFPPKAWYQKIADTVGEDEARLREWGEVCLAYVGMGWNPTNVKVMLEFYVRGEMPGNTRARASPRDEPRGYAAVREFKAQLEAEERNG